MRQSQYKSRGFTLIEVLAATGIMAVVILVVLSMTTNVLSVWNRSSGKLNSNYEARVALDLLATDFETLVMRNRPFCWIEVKYSEPDAGDLDYGGALPLMPELYFMARVEDRPRFTSNSSGGDPERIYGDICAVAYRVLYQDPIDPDKNEFPMFGLYRFIIDSEFTFTDVMNAPTDGDGNVLPVDSLLEQMKDSQYRDENGDVQRVDTDIIKTIQMAENFLSANIVDMRVVFYYSDPLNNNQIKPITVGNSPTGDPLPFIYSNALYINNSSTSIPGTLEFVDIAITVMSPEGLAIVESESAEAGVNWPQLVTQYGTTFSRRVPIMAKPL